MYKRVLKHFFTFVVHSCDSKGLSNEELSVKTGLRVGNIENIFSLRYKVSLYTFLLIAKAIEVNFFFEDRENESDLNIAFEKAMREMGRRKNDNKFLNN